MPEPAPPRFDVLLQGYLENSLTPAESTELLAMLKLRPELGTRLVDEIAINDLLRTTVREADLQDAGLPLNSARRSSVRVVRIRTKPVAASTGNALAAASAAIVVLASLFYISNSSHAPRRLSKGAIDKKTDTPAWHERELSHVQTRLEKTDSKLMEARERLNRLETEQVKLAGAKPQATGMEEERLQVLRQLELQRAQVERELSMLSEARTKAEHELVDLIAIQKVETNPAAVSQTPKTHQGNVPLERIEIGRVQFASKSVGAVVIKPDGVSEVLREGMALRAGDRIETRKGASASREAASVITMGIGATIDLADDTILECTQERSLKLLQGLVYADVLKNYDDDTKRDGAFKLVIVTPAATAGVLGTRFELSVDASSTRVRMEEGLLNFFNDLGRERIGALQESRAVEGSKPEVPSNLVNLWRGRKGLAKTDAISFQDGVQPGFRYAGTDDTMIEQFAPTATNGSNTILEVDGGGIDKEANEMFALLRWKLPGIPKESTIVGASLELNVTNASEKRPFQIFELLRPFSEQTANWQHFDGANQWEKPGAQGDRDHNRTLLGTIKPGSTGVHTAVFNERGVAVIRRWIATPENNNGLLISRDPRSTDGFRFSSRENSDPAMRPKLTINLLTPQKR